MSYIKKEILFSIITTVYNTNQLYLEQCLKSILNQSYKNIELIIIDDGSNKQTAAYCDQFTEDNRVKVFHYNNQGVSVARNIGINKAVGEFIIFVDSDDWIELDMCEKIRLFLDDNKNIDVLIYKYIDEFKNSSTKKSVNELKCIFFDEEMITSYCKGLVCEKYMPLKGVIGSPWGRVFKSNFLKQNCIEFPRGISTIEDKIFNLRVCQHNPDIAFLNSTFYHYRQRKNSLCRTHFDINVYMEYIELMEKTIKLFPTNYIYEDAFREFVLVLYINNLRNIIISSNFQNYINLRKNVKKSLFIFDKYNLHISIKNLSIAYRIYFNLIKKNCYTIVKILYNINQFFKLKKNNLFE